VQSKQAVQKLQRKLGSLHALGTQYLCVCGSLGQPTEKKKHARSDAHLLVGGAARGAARKLPELSVQTGMDIMARLA
jgi:hypothetical protein